MRINQSMIYKELKTVPDSVKQKSLEYGGCLVLITVLKMQLTPPWLVWLSWVECRPVTEQLWV